MTSIKSCQGIEAAAFHEAGHSFMFMYFGRKIDYMTIDDDGNGYVQCPVVYPSKLVNI